ncbi:MAG: DUF4169 family protein [Pseudomonadota bacterium]
MAQRPSRGLNVPDPINLNKFRKAKKRSEKAQRAQENRLKHGRTKAEKARDAHSKARHTQQLDQTRRDK